MYQFPKTKIDTYRGTEGSGFLWLCRTFQMIDGRTITIASHHETTISCSCLIYAVDATTRQKRMTNARETIRMRIAFDSCSKSFLGLPTRHTVYTKCSSIVCVSISYLFFLFISYYWMNYIIWMVQSWGGGRGGVQFSETDFVSRCLRTMYWKWKRILMIMDTIYCML